MERKMRDRIRLFGESAQAVIVTSFHPFHLDTGYTRLYKNKRLLIKNPNQFITAEQRNPAFSFLKKIRGIPAEIIYADNRELRFSEVRIVFSKPLSRGKGNSIDTFLMTAFITDHHTFVFSSHTEGLDIPEACEFIISQDPEILYLDGPDFLNQEGTSPDKTADLFVKQCINVLETTRVVRLILDHHPVRDPAWRKRIDPLLSFANNRGIEIRTAAESRGEANHFLEARRKELYETDPVKEQE
jgi:hypothetical protein